MKHIKLFENFENKYIDINDIKTEKEIILVDTKYPNDIINAVRNGLMPLDKLRVETMANVLLSGKKLPPIIISNDNLIIDGYHRYAAHKLAGINKISFIYKK